MTERSSKRVSQEKRTNYESHEIIKKKKKEEKKCDKCIPINFYQFYLEIIIHFHINIIAGCFLLVCPLYRDGMVDDNRVWWEQQLVQSSRNLCELHPRHTKDLQSFKKFRYVQMSICFTLIENHYLS